MKKFEVSIADDLIKWANEHQMVLNDFPLEEEKRNLRREKLISNPRTSDTSKLAFDYRILITGLLKAIKSQPNLLSINAANIENIDCLQKSETQFSPAINKLYILRWGDDNQRPANELIDDLNQVMNSIQKQMIALNGIKSQVPLLADIVNESIIILYRIYIRIQTDFYS